MPQNVFSFITYLQLEKNYSDHTLKAYEKDILDFAKFCKANYSITSLEEIQYPVIRTWISVLVSEGISNRSINRKVSSLKSFYKFLQKSKQISTNPLVKHKALKVAKKVQVPFSKEEIRAAITTLDGNSEFETLRDKLIVEMLYATGMRRAELINLKVRDIDLSNRTIRVLGKRDKERIIPLIPLVKTSLESYLKERNSFVYSEYLFVTNRQNKLYPSLVYSIINKYFSTVSSKTKKSPHVLRHSFATHLLDEGADLNSVKELLGHASLASTQVYTHSSLSKLKEVYNSTHPRSTQK
ncbi:site-specific tyrosine recombinase/integron integrase [Urechidicola sp. KH5]